MRGSIFFETLRQTRRQMLYWGIGLGLMGFLVVMIVPDVDALKQMTAFLERFPPILLRAVGVGDDLSYFASPEGFVTIGFFGKTLIVLAAYPVVMGLRVTVNEEDSGTIDVLLSLPVPRWRVILEKFLAYLLTIGVIGALLFGFLWAGTVASGVTLNMGRVAQTVFNIMPSMTVILAFTLFIGAVVRRRRMAVGLATVFVIGSYMVDTIGQVARGSIAESLRAVSFFRYYDSTGVMQNGLIWGHVALLAAVSIVLLGGALLAFERRDVGV